MTLTSPLLSLPGAVAAANADEGVAAHYGEPMIEQRRLAAGEGVVDLSHRDVIRVGGPDRLTWLHQLTTQHFEQLEPGVPTSALVLDANGRVEHAMYGVDDGQAIWFHLERGTSATLIDYLEKMKFWSQVEISDVTDDYALLWEPAATPHDDFRARVTDRGREVFLPRELLGDYVKAAGQPAGAWAHEALRIEAREPRIGLDTDDRTIPHEVGWIGTAVHLDKGCYRGQETVARVHTLGRPPRRLVLLHLDGSAEHLPPHGAEITFNDRKVGFVGSSARHHELGPIALGVIKRNVPVDADLQADGVAAGQEVVVDPEIGLHVRPKLS